MVIAEVMGESDGECLSLLYTSRGSVKYRSGSVDKGAVKKKGVGDREREGSQGYVQDLRPTLIKPVSRLDLYGTLQGH